ncbi:response regulator [Dyella sp. Tek66A03]|uniref:response regulator n=1 Tax=Dyella sp. Tek66A03 TaxID=3458298 RepID=UPI00403E6415
MHTSRRQHGRSGRKPRLLLADDHRCIAEGLAGLLAPITDSVAIVHDGESLVETVLAGSIDMVVSEIGLPALGGVQALGKLRTQGCHVPFIVLTTHDEPLIVRQALESGANGYVLKQSASAELYAAIAAVAGGEHYISPSLMASLLQEPVLSRKLTHRQRQVIDRMAGGRRTTEIAAELGISIRTVESHRQALLGLLGVHSSVALIREAERLGLIAPGSSDEGNPTPSSVDLLND